MTKVMLLMHGRRSYRVVVEVDVFVMIAYMLRSKSYEYY